MGRAQRPSAARPSGIGRRGTDPCDLGSVRRTNCGGTLDQVCLDRIARFKRPKEYRFVDALPTNNYGKVLKRELREQLSAETSGPPCGPDQHIPRGAKIRLMP